MKFLCRLTCGFNRVTDGNSIMLKCVFTNGTSVEVPRETLLDKSIFVRTMLEDNPEATEVPLHNIPSAERLLSVLDDSHANSVEQRVNAANDANFLHCQKKLEQCIDSLVFDIEHGVYLEFILTSLVPDVLNTVMANVNGTSFAGHVLVDEVTLPLPWDLDYVVTHCGIIDQKIDDTAELLKAASHFVSAGLKGVPKSKEILRAYREGDVAALNMYTDEELSLCIVRYQRPLHMVLYAACYFGHKQLYDFYLERGYSILPYEIFTVSMLMGMQGKLEMYNYIVSHQSSIAEYDNTLLSCASSNGYLRRFMHLLSKDQLNALSDFGPDEEFWSPWNSFPDISQYLSGIISGDVSFCQFLERKKKLTFSAVMINNIKLTVVRCCYPRMVKYIVERFSFDRDELIAMYYKHRRDQPILCNTLFGTVKIRASHHDNRTLAALECCR